MGRALSGRGVVVVHRGALRVLDRVDCLVLQGDLLVTDDLVPAEIAPVGDADPAELRRVVRSLLDPACPTADVRRDGWELAPVDRLGPRLAGPPLHGPGDDVPWGADIIATGLHDAALLVEACAGARAASLWSARTATLGASLAAFLAFRPLPGTGLRVGTAVNGAALVAMAGGTRSAMALAHRPRPLPRDPTPWHALEPQAVLERTGSGPDGLSPAEAGRRLPPRQHDLARPLRLARDMADELVNPLTPIPAVRAGLPPVTGAPVDAATAGGGAALNALLGGAPQ